MSEKTQSKARVSALYEVDFAKGVLKLKNKRCPRCGNVMALHRSPVQRWTCGSCSYTDFVKAAKAR